MFIYEIVLISSTQTRCYTTIMQMNRGVVLNILTLAMVLFMIFALASDTTPVGQVGNSVNLRSELPANVARFAPKDADAIPFKANIKIK